MHRTIIIPTEKYSIKVEHTVQRSTVASLQGAPVNFSSFEIMSTNQASAPVLQLLKRGDSYFVSAGTGKLLPASLSDLMSSWAGVAMAFEAGYIRNVMRYIRLHSFSNGHLHITGEKTSSPCTVTLSFSESPTHSITIPSEALNTWPARILQWENKRLSSGEGCTCDWKMDKDLASYRQLRKRASTQAMRENAEPNKRTDRSQYQDDDQITAHLLKEIRRKSQKKEGYVQKTVRRRLRLYCCGCEEDVTGGGDCRRCGHSCTSCPVCLHERRLRRERSVDPSHEPNQANKHHDAQTNNQTRAVPATHLSQAIEIDEDPETETDSVLYMLPLSKLKRKLREKQQKQQTWVNRAIKCCSCEVTGSAVNKCACGHEYCGICFYYESDPTTRGGDIFL
ncbi:hypothetical protein ACJ73_02205 [Blastomyces percursus]|uniref:Uncharacterized protein n=1 Tax=Blastomyces percursus TaxID=1658174 RepID=A0A1J9QC27_9EURO|nr:hypothetical protein ACJ73_02205 [Blastomyces percursus]